MELRQRLTDRGCGQARDRPSLSVPVSSALGEIRKRPNRPAVCGERQANPSETPRSSKGRNNKFQVLHCILHNLMLILILRHARLRGNVARGGGGRRIRLSSEDGGGVYG